MKIKRRGFFGTVAGGVVLSALSAKGVAKGAKKEKLVLSPPVAMAPRDTGIEFVWQVSRLCRSWIELKTSDGIKTFSEDGWGFVPQGEKRVRIRLDGLKPGTTYQYRAVTESMEKKKEQPVERIESEWRTFKTLNPKAKSTQFVVWNDTHNFKKTIKLLDEKTPAADFLLWNGDANRNIWNLEKDIPSVLLHPAKTDFTAKRPLFFSFGNHDARGAYGFKVQDYVAMPEGKPYYAFRSGPVAAVVLDTGEDKADAHPSFKGRVNFDALRQEQVEWFRKTVLTTPEFRNAPYRVMFCHIPLRWKTERGPNFSRSCRKAWQEMLIEWKLQVVVSGHTHFAVALEANKKYPYAQFIGGGPHLNDGTWIVGKANSRKLQLTAHYLADKPPITMSFPPLSRG